MSDTLLTPPPAAPEAGAPPPSDTAPPSPPSGELIQPPETPDWSGALKADGSFDPKAHEYGIPEHLKSIGGVMESYKNMQRMKGAPGPEATPEQLEAYRVANGIPEVVNAEAYGLTLPDELKEVYGEDSLNEIVKAANESAHLGHREMMQAVVGKFAELEIAGLAGLKAEGEAAQAAKLEENAKLLEADPAFKGANKEAALQTSANALNAALVALGVVPDSEEAKEVARSPLMVRILHHYGSKTSQDTTPAPGGVQDLRSGEEQANDIITNPNNPDYARYHEGDDEVGKKVLRLMGAQV